MREMTRTGSLLSHPSSIYLCRLSIHFDLINIIFLFIIECFPIVKSLDIFVHTMTQVVPILKIVDTTLYICIQSEGY